MEVPIGGVVQISSTKLLKAQGWHCSPNTGTVNREELF